jgi:hypothetical protein
LSPDICWPSTADFSRAASTSKQPVARGGLGRSGVCA